VDLGRTVEEKRPEIVVLAAVDVDRFQHSVQDLAALTRHASLRLAGVGATAAVADAVGATVLAEDPVTEAQRLTPPV
jgi:hypothetical protein